MSTDNTDNLGQVIKDAIIAKGMTYAAVAKRMKLPRQSIHRLNLRKTFDLEFLQKLKAATDLDYTNYVFNARHGKYQELTEEPSMLNEPAVNYTVTKVVGPESDDIGNVAKWIDPNHHPIPVFDSTEEVETLSELLTNEHYKPTVLLLKGHRGCNLVVRHVDGAMYKDFPARCQLGIKRVRNFKTSIIPGTPYIVIFDELSVTRYVHFGESENKLLLRSSDPDRYPDIPVEKSDIIEMWKILSATEIPETRNF